MYDEGAVGDFSKQHHDWNPGIKPSGLFWTQPISPSAITVNATTGEARLQVTNLAVSDYHDIINSIFGGAPPVPGHCSFDITWAGGGEPQTIVDETFGFRGTFIGSDARATFVAVDDGEPLVVYRSNADGQVSLGAGVGREWNGVFFD